jgi:hypothetical protein
MILEEVLTDALVVGCGTYAERPSSEGRNSKDIMISSDLPLGFRHTSEISTIANRSLCKIHVRMAGCLSKLDLFDPPA